ncbi:HD family phosphohydrolase [Catellicoccus marimammalium]
MKNRLTQHNGKWYMPVLMILFSLSIFALLFHNVQQKELNLHEGQVASETIRANKTVENKYETREKQRIAEEAVVPEYNYDDNLKSAQINMINQLFDLVNKVNKEDKKLSVDEKIAKLKKKFEDISSDHFASYQKLPESFYQQLFSLSHNELENARKVSTALVDKYMSMHIRTNTLANTKQQALRELDQLQIPKNEHVIDEALINNGLVVNEISNSKKTEELREKAKQSVAPVMIYQGEIIVREGSPIDAKAMEKLKALGLTNKSTTLFPLEALILTIVFQVILILYTAKQMSSLTKRKRFILFYVMMMLISIVVMKFLQLFQGEGSIYIPYLFPAAFMPLVLNIFINRRTAVMAVIFQAIFAMFAFYHSIGTSTLLMIIITYVLTGLLATLVKRKRIAQQIFPSFLWLIAYPVIFQVILMIYQGMDFTSRETWLTLLCVVIGCGLSFLLTMGMHPYIELILTDDSSIVLNELSNPNQPLLKRLLEEAPGTYHHSMMVANLSANAVAEIGGRSMATRVGCYYHDIGKVKHANFFVENLPAGAENPHKFLLPEDSRQIIFGHITDGIKMLQDAHMPQSIIDICAQHHGTTLMRYFYVTAKERDDSVTEEEYRYPGPKPQTKEAAVVSIADSSEAAVRAMGQPSSQQIADFVHNLINNRIEDGQFDECDITMKELRIVEKSIVNGLCSTFHSRIQYPELKKDDHN